MSVKEKKQDNGTEQNSEQNSGPLTSDFLKSVPRSPGVYLMKNRRGQILYVGKAKDLRKRLSSYQRSESAASPKTILLLKKVASIDTILTHTEKEAFILESQFMGTLLGALNIAYYVGLVYFFFINRIKNTCAWINYRVRN